MSLSPLDVCVQLPAEKRWGRIIAGSSTRQQAAREADAVGQLGARYIGWLLSRREEQERKRAEKRRAREARWREVMAGERPGLSVDQVTALWSDYSEAETGVGIGTRRRRQAAEAALV